MAQEKNLNWSLVGDIYDVSLQSGIKVNIDIVLDTKTCSPLDVKQSSKYARTLSMHVRLGAGRRDTTPHYCPKAPPYSFDPEVQHAEKLRVATI